MSRFVFSPAELTLCSDVTSCDVAVALAYRGEEFRWMKLPFSVHY
jgi:hypothetical protein